MIQPRTVLTIADNSGAKKIRCIRSLGGFDRTYSFCGDIFCSSVRSLRLNRKVKVGDVSFAILLRAKKASRFRDGSLSKFRTNASILLNKKRRILGTRFFGPVSKKVRKKKLFRLIVMSESNFI